MNANLKSILAFWKINVIQLGLCDWTLCSHLFQLWIIPTNVLYIFAKIITYDFFFKFNFLFDSRKSLPTNFSKFMMRLPILYFILHCEFYSLNGKLIFFFKTPVIGWVVDYHLEDTSGKLSFLTCNTETKVKVKYLNKAIFKKNVSKIFGWSYPSPTKGSYEFSSVSQSSRPSFRHPPL